MKKITHSELVDIGAIWLNKKASNIKYRAPFVVKEFVCAGVNEIPDVFGLRPGGRHVVIEVKTSRADFLKDFKKRSRLPRINKLGNFRFYLAPKDLIKVWDLPEPWGLLEWDGKHIKVAADAAFVATNHQITEYVYHSILRRKHKYQIFNFKK